MGHLVDLSTLDMDLQTVEGVQIHEKIMLEVNLDACAQLCLADTSFKCASFDYVFNEQSCQVSQYIAANVHGMQTGFDREHNVMHYEVIGDILCKIVNFCPIFAITSSIYTLVSVSYERRRAIIESNRKQLTFKDLHKVIPAIWIFGLVVSIPTLIEYNVNTVLIQVGDNITREQLSCGSLHMPDSFSISNAIFVVMIAYIIPMVTMCKNYIQVARFLVNKGKQLQRSGNRVENMQRLHNRIKVVKLLIFVAVIFAVSWLPFFITLLYAKITHKDASDDAQGFVNMFLISLATFSTAYNVVLYVVYNPSFSRAIKEVLRCGHARVSPINGAIMPARTRSEFLPEERVKAAANGNANQPIKY